MTKYALIAIPLLLIAYLAIALWRNPSLWPWAVGGMIVGHFVSKLFKPK